MASQGPRRALVHAQPPQPPGLSGLVDELAACLAGTSSGEAGSDPDSSRARLLGFALRLADSSLASSAVGDPEAAFHTIRQRLEQQARHHEAARVCDLYQQLCRTDGLSARGRHAILNLLQQCADRTTSLAASSIASYRPLQLPKVAAVRGSSGGGLPDAGSGPSDQPSKQGIKARATAACSATPAVPHQQPNGALPVALVKQPALVKDVLRAVQGLTGRYSSFAPAPGGSADPACHAAGIRLAPNDQLQLPAGQRTLLHELGELGLLYRRVQEAIRAGRQQGSGSVRQALCGALAEEVTDFYRLMAVLESQLAVPMPVPGDGCGAADDEPCSGEAIGVPGSGGPYLSLRRLQLWLSEPLRRMRLLAALVDASDGHIGGDLAGRVWAASKVGDPLARAYATRILHQMCVPLFGMIRHWVFEGALEDPACEFFVVPSHEQQPGAAGAPRDLWRDAYRLEPVKLPPFVSGELAAAILRAGKSINFLRDACGDGAWVQAWAPGAARAAAALGYGQLPVLEGVVVSAGREVDARLMAVLRCSGEWERHCQAIRRYLLLGQGDFVVALLDVLGPELAKPAADVSEVTLNHLLRTALLASAGGGEEGGPGERLRARKAIAAAGDSGWDVFALHYQLGPPLSSIFTPGGQASYSRISRLLWLLRRTERSLGSAWQTLKVEVERTTPRFAADACAARLQGALRAFLRLRAEMAHFVANLQTYLNLEVLECAWADFVAASAAAPDLDCLIQAHERFLSGVLDRALLGPGKAEALRPLLHQLLANCMGLAPLVGRFKEKVQLGLRGLELRAAAAATNTAAGRWGNTAASREPAVAAEELEELMATLGQLADRHSQLLRKLLKALPDAANEVNAEVRFLLARLDLSGFYA